MVTIASHGAKARLARCSGGVARAFGYSDNHNMSATARVRFGVFEFDPATRELFRDGAPVRLQAQPAQALALLLAHAGEAVTRETLRGELWGEETFVDFDGSLNYCIAQIRTALGDSADSPRFVQTLPKRGYRFIAPIGRTAPPKTGPSPAWRRQLYAPGLWLTVALTIVCLVLVLRPVAKSGGQSYRTVAVLRFDNETGDPALTRLADALTDSAVVELTLATGSRFDIIGNAAILRGPREHRDLLAIGRSLHAGYIILGQVQRQPAGLRILAHLIRLPDQKHIWVVRFDSPVEQAESGQSDLARRMAAEFAAHLDADRARQTASPASATR
jgi:DNA-binding winged helix-turn-helix (wHTH) protein/TolB-like protein